MALQWEKKNRIGFGQVLEELNSAAKGVVKRELDDIYSKLKTLHSMGVITDIEKLSMIENKIKELK